MTRSELDIVDYGFCQVTEEKLWEVEELYASNIAVLKEFVTQLEDYGLVDQVSPDLLAILEDITYIGPPESAKDKPSKSSKPVKAAKDKAKADKASKDTRSKHVKEPEPEPMDAVDESVLEHVPTSSAEVKQSPESANKPLDKAADGPDLNIEAILVADSQEVAEEAPEPEIKAKGGRRKAAAGGRKKATTKRKGKQQVELEEEAEAEDSSQVAESASQVPASQQSASQGPTSQSFSQAPASLPASQVVDSQEASTPPENEDEDSAPSKKGGRKIRLRKQPASGKEKEAPGTNADAAKGAALGRGARGKKEVKPAKTEAELTVDDEAEKSMTEEQLPAKRADEKMVPDSATIDERKATGQAVESVAKSMPAAGPKSSEPIVSRFAGTNFVALAQQRKEELTESRQQSDAHTRESDLLNKRPIVENVRPVSKKPRHDLFPEVKVPAMKLPRLADTLSSVDFALRPSIATNMDSIVHEPESHAAAEIVERAETEAARQDERLQTIIKSSVDKLKGDLFRLKKTAGSDSSSSSGGSSGPSSQGSMEPARVRSALDNAKLSNKASESDWSRPNRDGSRDRERAGPSELTSPPTETSQKQRPQESRVADESQNQGSEDHLATSQGFNLIRETMPETSQPSQASIESESRLSMSFFGAVHAENLAGAATFLPPELNKEIAAQKKERVEIKALAAAMSAKEKEDQDRERRNRMKQEVEEKRKEALLRKQHDEAKRAEDLKRKDEEWKKKAEGPVRVPNMAAGGSDKAKDARSAADSGDKAKYNVKDPKSNIPSLNKKPEVVPVSSKPAGIVVTGSQEKATSAAPKRPRSPDPAPEEPRKQAKLEPQSAVPVKPSKAIAEVAPAVKVVGPSAAPKPFAVEVPKPAVPPASMKPIANPILSPGFLAPPKGQPSPQSITELYGGEIPDIPSDESDDEEENKAPVPGWAQTPNLNFALASQSNLNPERVFGKVQPLALEDVFQNPARAHKYHKRTSSGNWGGADRLTAEEEEDYARAMGFL